jgi:hypothetical protein
VDKNVKIRKSLEMSQISLKRGASTEDGETQTGLKDKLMKIEQETVTTEVKFDIL